MFAHKLPIHSPNLLDDVNFLGQWDASAGEGTCGEDFQPEFYSLDEEVKRKPVHTSCPLTSTHIHAIDHVFPTAHKHTHTMVIESILMW